MSTYQFDGVFRDTSWDTMPTPDEVRRSVTAAIAGSSAAVFGINVQRVDVSTVASPLPFAVDGGYPEATVVVTWQSSGVSNQGERIGEAMAAAEATGLADMIRAADARVASGYQAESPDAQ